jgi:cytoskeletal protein CcmA (bactofilin family)
LLAAYSFVFNEGSFPCPKTGSVNKEVSMALWNQATPESSSEKPVSPASAATPSVIPAAPSSAPTPAPAPKESSTAGRRESVFGPGVTIEGKIEGDADIRIGGKFKGDILIKGDLNLDKGAKILAKVHAANVSIGGELEGNVVAGGQVKLLESGQLVGDLKAATLTVAAGSRMRGNVEFGWSAGETAKFVNGHVKESEKAGAAG